jgi:predicted O-methyltransferase YrrM
MSVHDPFPSDLLSYVGTLFAPENAALSRLTAAARAAKMPEGWEITPDVGKTMELLCRAIGARRALEFGTLAGHSAYWLAQGVGPEGRVVSIEIQPDYAAAATAALRDVGLGDRVQVRIGAAWDMTEALAAEIEAGAARFDAIFLDADKARYPEFLEWAPRVLRPGGLLFADNVLRADSWRGQTLLDPKSDDPRILAIRRFNKSLATHPDFTAMILPMRAGLAVGLYRPGD